MNNRISAASAGWLYAYIHFAVEAACFFFLVSRLRAHPIWWVLAMLYDALAFLPQCILGLALDHWPRIDYGSIGCGLILLALVLPWDLAALVLLCLGNALAHVAGAQKTLGSSGGKIAPCGIFVGGGSFGVITGQLLGAAGGASWLVLILMAAALAAARFVYCRRAQARVWDGPDITATRSNGWIVVLAFAAVAVRAYIGYAIPTEWNKTDAQAVALFGMMGLGKALGGVLADRIGYRRTTLMSLLLGLPFLLFGNRLMLLSLIGVGLFSMTMPITIGILTSRFPKMPCFCFGITTVALFAGTLPAFFLRPESLIAHQTIVFLLSALAAVCILTCLKKGK